MVMAEKAQLSSTSSELSEQFAVRQYYRQDNEAEKKLEEEKNPSQGPVICFLSHRSKPFSLV